MRRGFTVVELIITITVMGILLTLAVVGMNASQVNARDSERVADIESLSTQIEGFYANGSGSATFVGRYPSTGLLNNGETSLKFNLPDIDPKVAIPPGSADVATGFIVATNAVETVAGVAPQPTTGQYVYQPIATGDTLCTSGAQECRRFNLYYRLEKDNTVYKVTSKHQ